MWPAFQYIDSRPELLVSSSCPLGRRWLGGQWLVEAGDCGGNAVPNLGRRLKIDLAGPGCNPSALLTLGSGLAVRLAKAEDFERHPDFGFAQGVALGVALLFFVNVCGPVFLWHRVTYDLIG